MVRYMSHVPDLLRRRFDLGNRPAISNVGGCREGSDTRSTFSFLPGRHTAVGTFEVGPSLPTDTCATETLHITVTPSFDTMHATAAARGSLSLLAQAEDFSWTCFAISYGLRLALFRLRDYPSYLSLFQPRTARHIFSSTRSACLLYDLSSLKAIVLMIPITLINYLFLFLLLQLFLIVRLMTSLNSNY